MSHPLSPWLRELPPPLIAAGLLLTSAGQAGMPPPVPAAIVAAIGAFSVYWADHRLGTVAGDTWPRDHRLWLLILPAVILLATMSLSAPSVHAPGVAVYLMLAVLYVFPLLPGNRRLQDFPRGRTWTICLGWTLMPLLLTPLAPTPRTLLFLGGWCSLITPNVWINDLAHHVEDQTLGRPTWAGTRPPGQIRTLCLASLLLSMGLFSLCGSRTLFLLPPLIFTVILLTADPRRAARLADWLLCLPLFLTVVP